MGKPAENGGVSAQEVEARVREYIDRLEGFLKQCANDVEDRPDAFLWNARRSLEAMLLAVSTKAGIPKPPDMGIGKLLEQFESKDGLIDPDVRGALRNLQSEGNYGTHLQNHDRMAFSQPAKRCRQSLVDAVNWFFQRSNIRPREVPEPIREALAVIEGEAPSPARIQRKRADDERTRLEREQEKLRAERDTLQQDLKVAGEQMKTLKRKLEELEREQGRPATARGEDGTRPRGIRRPAVLAVAVLLGGTLGAFGVAWLMSEQGRHGDAETVPPSVHDAGNGTADPIPGDGGAGVTPIVATDAGGGVDAGEGADAGDAGAPLGCPEGMVKFNGGLTKFGEPYPRSSWWSDSKKTGLSATVSPFCIDRTEVPAKAFALKGTAAALEPPRFKRSSCHRAGKSGQPMNCVTHDEASQHCANRSARLPKLVEWEHIASLSSKSSIDIPEKGHEWIEDAFPSPAWPDRAPELCDGGPCYFLAREESLPKAPSGGARYSWMRYPVDHWAGDVTFRCAQDYR